MNHISPCNHPESYLTGSTISSMVKKASSLGNKYFAYTDQGKMTGLLKAYVKCKNSGIKLIPGVELFFKDDNCEIIKSTESERVKYFKIILHAKDQESYQELVKLISSKDKKTAIIGEEVQNLYTWKDLEDISKFNITAATADLEDMVCKHLLVNRPDLGLKYYEKLREIFGKNNFFPTVIPFEQNKYWHKAVNLKLSGHEVKIPAEDKIETDSKYKKNTAQDLLRKNGGHSKITHVYLNNIKYKVKEDFQDIEDVDLVNEFTDFECGDVQLNANRFILGLAKKFGDLDNVLINNYSFYSEKEDKVVQDMKLGNDKRVFQSQYMASTEDVKDYLLKKLEVGEVFVDKLVQNSVNFCSSFDGFELKYDYRLPEVGENPEKKLMDIVKDRGRMKWDDPRYVKQLREELELLTKNGVLNLVPYFLPLVDIYKYYDDNGYLTGAGRGSAGGFLLSYLIGITHVDPIKYELSSARFLTMGRVKSGSLPDIDCDLQDRSLLVGKDGNGGYLKKVYGNKAAQCSTRTLLRIKSAILDANRFVNKGKVEKEIEQLSKSLPNTPQGVEDSDFVFGYEDREGNHIPGLLEKNEDLQKYAVERPKEWDIVKKALSLSRQHSRHACSFFIADTNIEDIVPIMEIGGVKRVTQPEASQCEWAGLIKYDFLVISVLKDIKLCIDLINKKNKENHKTGYFTHNGEETYIWDLPEDQGVFDMLSRGETETVFQLNTVSVTPFVKKIKPKSIVDCAVVTSLVRPGPLDFIDEKTNRNMAEEYIERRCGRSKGDIEILNDMLSDTYGVFVFQEQVSGVTKKLTGWDDEKAEEVRIAVGKKKIKMIEDLKPQFIESSVKNGYDRKTVSDIWAMIETFGRYGFNRSHAVAYSMASYACAFLKHHYKLEWWAAVLSNADNKEINEVFYKYTKDLVLPPDINTSTEVMSVDYKNGKIRNKLSVISGLGEKLANKIVEQRPYKGLKDFIKKGVCGQSMTKKLIRIGALDSFFDKEDTLIKKIYKFDKTVNEVEFEKKKQSYIEKIEKEIDLKEKEKIIKRMNKIVEKGPKEPDYDSSILTGELKDFMIKKSIFPSMNLDLHSILLNNSDQNIVKTKAGNYIRNTKGFETRIINSDSLHKLDNSILNSNAYFCCPGYVLNAEEFGFSKNTKKALRISIDSSGYISEKVIWPDYNTGELNYDKALKKGCVAWFFYYKGEGREGVKVIDVIVENNHVD